MDNEDVKNSKEMEFKNEPNDEEVPVDPFSSFMFGHPRKRNISNDAHEDYHGDWLFGRRLPHHEEPTSNRDDHPFNFSKHPHSEESNKQSLGHILQNVNYIELMGHVDQLIDSAGQLKPLFNKIKPIVEQFLNKK
ncbi:hypothetical protein SM124_01100 [Bacillus sp. 31A1R]|uniref:Uncharacterized protein n=1 Tax=Robertmurraya mangrovi TaxID=3098077 RepID=A0ABU5IT54_9BACI|nr:hypothetical protein [Bacillus sp. 31A1R]MDZ5470334.1 hypothetical protein [Bacillus sp. 31A1R]